MKKLFVLAPYLMGLWTGSVFAEDCISLEEIRSTHSKNMEKADESNKKH